MEDSILTGTKKILGIDESYTVFDLDILTHINSVFSTLAQIGIGPEHGFMIEDATPTWEDFLGLNAYEFNSVKTFVYLKVRLAFDPPGTSFAIGSLEKQADEYLWRLNILRESTEWVDPDPELNLEDNLILDGGSP